MHSKKTPLTIKALGKKCQLRDDWEQVKLSIMEQGVRTKFTQNPELRKLLIDIRDHVLEEGNRWRDTFWGIDLNKNKR